MSLAINAMQKDEVWELLSYWNLWRSKQLPWPDLWKTVCCWVWFGLVLIKETWHKDVLRNFKY